MIKFESSDTPPSRNAAHAAKAVIPAVATPQASALETSADELFSSENATASDEAGTGGKKPRGRSKRFGG